MNANCTKSFHLVIFMTAKYATLAVSDVRTPLWLSWLVQEEQQDSG